MNRSLAEYEFEENSFYQEVTQEDWWSWEEDFFDYYKKLQFSQLKSLTTSDLVSFLEYPDFKQDLSMMRAIDPKKFFSSLERIFEKKKNKQEMFIWQDQNESKKKRLLIICGSKLMVFQWEVYSNFCGGPYASYSCGMG